MMKRGKMENNKFILWGYGQTEYEAMFQLTKEDYEASILEFGAGASSFNAEMYQQGRQVTSIDSLFDLSHTVLTQEVDTIFENTLKQIQLNQEYYNLKAYGDLKGLIAHRKKGLEQFFSDYPVGLEQGRYRSFDGLPLAYDNYAFNLALVCHHLFVGHDLKDLDEHVAIIKELVRVAGEVRIFPLIDKYGQTSNLLGPVLLALQQLEVGTEVKEVPSQLQPTGNAMLKVWALKCDMK